MTPAEIAADLRALADLPAVKGWTGLYGSSAKQNLEALAQAVEQITYVEPGSGEEVFFYPRGASAWCILPNITSVFLVWGEDPNSISEFRDDARNFDPGHVTPLQRNLMAARLRYIADRIEVHPGILVLPEGLQGPIEIPKEHQ